MAGLLSIEGKARIVAAVDSGQRCCAFLSRFLALRRFLLEKNHYLTVRLSNTDSETLLLLQQGEGPDDGHHDHHTGSHSDAADQWPSV